MLWIKGKHSWVTGLIVLIVVSMQISTAKAAVISQHLSKINHYSLLVNIDSPDNRSFGVGCMGLFLQSAGSQAYDAIALLALISPGEIDAESLAQIGAEAVATASQVGTAILELASFRQGLNSSKAIGKLAFRHDGAVTSGNIDIFDSALGTPSEMRVLGGQTRRSGHLTAGASGGGSLK